MLLSKCQPRRLKVISPWISAKELFYCSVHALSWVSVSQANLKANGKPKGCL